MNTSTSSLLKTAALTAKQIAGSADTNELAHQAIILFFNILANFIANGILSTGARQGVYISGGIAPELKDFLPQSSFSLGYPLMVLILITLELFLSID